MSRARDISDGKFANELTVDGSAGATFKLTSTDTTGADTELLGQIDFVSSDSSTGSAGTQARIKGVYEDNGDSSGIAFITGASTGSGTPTITEKMRIRHEGDICIGNSVANTASGYSNQPGGGFVASDSHFEFATTSNRAPVEIGKNEGNNGQLIAFRKQGTTIGSIGNGDGGGTDGLDISGANGYIGINTGDTNNYGGIEFLSRQYTQAPRVRPMEDNDTDIGDSANRFDDIFATNGTIQTSDQNEKQQIASLTTAEITAAKAISKLFKTFKWNSSVTENGDAARTHTGVIAQEVQTAMTDAGLDAGDYAFFIRGTWWEYDFEIPAVEADEEAGIEARDAYTRTRTYYTADEAPEGATQRTRLGIRYPELLAFIGAATEQRLADLETRVTALEDA